MKSSILALALILALYINHIVADGSEGGYGYGPNEAYDDGDYYDDEDLDKKKKLGIAAAIAIPIAVGAGVGVPLLKKKLLLPLAGLLGLPVPFPLPVPPVNGNNGGLTILLPGVLPGLGNLAVGNVRVPLFTIPTPVGQITVGFNKRSIKDDEQYGKCTNEIASTVWKIALVADMDNLCIPKAFCSFMAEHKMNSKPKTFMDKIMLEYINTVANGNEKLLLKKAYQDVVSYGSALGAYTKNSTMCEQVFNKCSEPLSDISSMFES